MKTFKKNQWKNLIRGANLLATGGGGTMDSALSILNNISSVQVIELRELKDKDLICTIFGVGGKQNVDPIKASQSAFSIFQKILNQKISAIVPVEIGPMAIANAIFIASELGIPLLDSDIVGLRSSPEVYLEIISLIGISRAPCVIADDKGNAAIIRKEKRVEDTEKFFRTFAKKSGGDAFVAGYPIKAGWIKKIFPKGSLTLSLKTGRYLNNLRAKKISITDFYKNAGWSELGGGIITQVKKDDSGGFSQGKYTIKSDKNVFKVIFRNENLVVLKDNEVLLTCPDSISLLDLRSFEAVNNFENNRSKRVAILGKKAISIWRTKKGKKLFSPRNLGLNYRQKLL